MKNDNHGDAFDEGYEAFRDGVPEKHRPKGPVTRPRIAVLDVPPITKLGTLLTLMCTSKEREHDLD